MLKSTLSPVIMQVGHNALARFNKGGGGEEGGGGSSTITELHVHISVVSWFGIKMTSLGAAGSNTDLTVSMDAASSASVVAVTSAGLLAANEYGTSHASNDKDREWNDESWDRGGNPADGANVQWNPASGIPFDIYYKFDEPITLGWYQIYEQGYETYGILEPTFRDQDGNILTPTSSPAGDVDAYTYESGTRTNRAYSWHFE